MKEARVNLPST